MKRNIGLAIGVVLLGALVMAQMTYLPMTTKVVTVCAAGCRYTSLNAACAAQTSTAAAPIEYRVGPGTFTGQVSCSGEDHARFIGAGMGVTTITASGVTGQDGTFKPGTSTNYTIEGFTFVGHQTVRIDGAGTGGGIINIQHNEFKTDGVNADGEDCLFYTDFAAATEIHLTDNVCRPTQDGYTFSVGGANVRIYSQGNKIVSSTITPTATMELFRFNSIPAAFYSLGDSFDLSASMAAVMEIYGYRFHDDVSGGCSSGCAAYINGVVSNITNANSGQNGSAASFINVTSTATALATLQITGVNSVVKATDATNTANRNIYIQNATTVTNVFGSTLSTSGGSINVDLIDSVGPGNIRVAGTTFSTVAAGEVVAADQTYIKSGLSADFIGPVTLTDNGTQTTNLVLNTAAVGRNMLTLDNTDETANYASPGLQWCDSTTAAGQDCWYITVNPPYSSMRFIDGSGMHLEMFPSDFQYYGNMQLLAAGAGFTVGNGAASDANFLKFDAGTTDASITWNDTNDRLEFTGATVYRFATLATAPSTCSIGDFYVDTSGAYCACTSSNTWSNMTPLVGSCA